MKLTIALAGGLILATAQTLAQTLNLPPRPPGAPTGSQFINIVTPMSLAERENWIYAQVTQRQRAELSAGPGAGVRKRDH